MFIVCASAWYCHLLLLPSLLPSLCFLLLLPLLSLATCSSWLLRDAARSPVPRSATRSRGCRLQEPGGADTTGGWRIVDCCVCVSISGLSSIHVSRRQSSLLAPRRLVQISRSLGTEVVVFSHVHASCAPPRRLPSPSTQHTPPPAPRRPSIRQYVIHSPD